MGTSQSKSADIKSVGIKLAISRLCEEYLAFVESTTVEVREVGTIRALLLDKMMTVTINSLESFRDSDYWMKWVFKFLFSYYIV